MPLSTSGFSSRSSNTRPAPASAITMVFICWEIMLTGLEKFLESRRNAASFPSVSPAPPEAAIAPPTMASTTYCTLPMLAIMGIRAFASLLALAVLRNRSSFLTSKPALASSSWQ